MSVKQSLVDNKKVILESLPTQELKDEFVAGLETMKDPEQPSTEELVKQAQEPEHITEDMYEGIKTELERDYSVAPMSESEQEQAMADNLKDVSTEPNEGSEEEASA